MNRLKGFIFNLQRHSTLWYTDSGQYHYNYGVYYLIENGIYTGNPINNKRFSDIFTINYDNSINLNCLIESGYQANYMSGQGNPLDIRIGAIIHIGDENASLSNKNSWKVNRQFAYRIKATRYYREGQNRYMSVYSSENPHDVSSIFNGFSGMSGCGYQWYQMNLSDDTSNKVYANECVWYSSNTWYLYYGYNTYDYVTLNISTCSIDDIKNHIIRYHSNYFTTSNIWGVSKVSPSAKTGSFITINMDPNTTYYYKVTYTVNNFGNVVNYVTKTKFLRKKKATTGVA